MKEMGVVHIVEFMTKPGLVPAVSSVRAGSFWTSEKDFEQFMNTRKNENLVTLSNSLGFGFTFDLYLIDRMFFYSNSQMIHEVHRYNAMQCHDL